jgi:peptidoglycan/LPS O-acetylase OafA/YrhL
VTEFFGDFAYTTYLVHYPVLYILSQKQLLPVGNPLSALAGIVVSYFIAWLMGVCVEKRYKSIRNAIWNALFRRGSARPHEIAS